MLAIKGLAGGRPGPRQLPGWRLLAFAASLGTARVIRSHAAYRSVSSVRSSSRHPLKLPARGQPGALQKKPSTRAANSSSRKFGSVAASKPLPTRFRCHMHGTPRYQCLTFALLSTVGLEASECPSKRVITARKSLYRSQKGTLRRVFELQTRRGIRERSEALRRRRSKIWLLNRVSGASIAQGGQESFIKQFVGVQPRQSATWNGVQVQEFQPVVSTSLQGRTCESGGCRPLFADCAVLELTARRVQ